LTQIVPKPPKGTDRERETERDRETEREVEVERVRESVCDQNWNKLCSDGMAFSRGRLEEM
jgi:hypothetical protein